MTATEPREIRAIQQSRRSAEHRYAWRLGDREFAEKVRAGLGLRLLGELATEVEGMESGEGGGVPGGVRSAGVDAALIALSALEEWGAGVDAASIASIGVNDPASDAIRRADFWGYVAPGKPSMAAEFAWRDLSPYHERSSLYAGMFVAATVSAAFVADDVLEAVYVGIGEVPDQSRFIEAIYRALRVHRTSAGWLEAVERLRSEAPGSPEDRPELMLSHGVLALLFGDGNPLRSWQLLADTEIAEAALNGAIGSILGVHGGVDGNSPTLLKRVPVRLEPQVARSKELTFDELVERTVAVANRLPRRLDAGGA